ncbi:MAG: phosphopentomutase [Tenericutes bacterium]|nr:phosphopentomutase [Mycoplasmatota bacterium]
MRFKRIFLIVLDGIGVGASNDADNYGDINANTLKHIHEHFPLFIPNLQKLGFLNTINMDDNPNVDAYYTIARPNNIGKESLTGHYELMGIKNEEPFQTFTKNGFPRELIEEIENRTGRRVIGNKAASGTEIIEELGERHLNYGALIVYTSADSTLQIAAHEDVIPISQLYKYCEIVRQITLKKEWLVGRVIARPFVGKPGKFKRTSERKDFALKPPYPSVLNFLRDKNHNVIAIGKINDIFDGEGINKVIKTDSNNDAINKLTDIMDKNFTGLCFTNLCDFDSIYGHRRNVEGFAKSIEEFDVQIPIILNKLNENDLLILTADHGNDPTMPGSDHTRENVPVVIFSRDFKEPKKLDILTSLANIGATIAENFELEQPIIGESVLSKLI